MKTYINGHGVSLRRLRHYDDEGARVMAIHTGLSVRVAGHLIELERDDASRTARVVVNGAPVTTLEVEAVKAAADMLAERARRFLGIAWTVVPWDAPRRSASRSA